VRNFKKCLMPPEQQQPAHVTPATDFDASKIATAVNKHDTDFIEVRERLDALEKRFGTNEQIAETLYEASCKQTKFEEMFAKLLVKLAGNDEGVKEAFTKVVKSVNDSSFKSFLGKFGVLILTGVTFVLGVVVTVLVTQALGG